MRAKRDYLRFADLTAEEVHTLLDHAIAMKNQRAHGGRRKPLEGKSVALIFEKSSTRTRVSFEVGVYELGGHPVVIHAKDSQLGRGESIPDTARTLSRYAHAIVLRTFGQDRVEELAQHASVPVVNALTDEEHPCQILADLMTVRERRGGLKGLRYAWVGDGNNVAWSWAAAAQVLGLDLTVASPVGYTLPDRALGGRVRATDDPREAVRGADVVITDVWTSMGQEAENARRLRDFAGWGVTPELMSQADPKAMVLHCLPAHRGEEIDGVFLDGPDAAVWDEAENRLHVQKALLELLLRG